MALFFICHLSSVIAVINNKTPERFGSVGNNAYNCRQKRKNDMETATLNPTTRAFSRSTKPSASIPRVASRPTKRKSGMFLVNGRSEATSYRWQMTDTKKHSTEVRRRVALRRDLREAPEHPRSARKCPFGPSAPVTRLNSRNSPPLKGRGWGRGVRLGCHILSDK